MSSIRALLLWCRLTRRPSTSFLLIQRRLQIYEQTGFRSVRTVTPAFEHLYIRSRALQSILTLLGGPIRVKLHHREESGRRLSGMHPLSGAVERTVRVLWVRHGETADNARHVIQGHIDTALNENGIKQSRATKNLLKDTKIDVCFTSDLQRARRTAEIILEDHHNDTPLLVDERIKEKYLGLLQGHFHEYYEKAPPEVLASVETLQAFTDRTFNFWDALFPTRSSVGDRVSVEQRDGQSHSLSGSSISTSQQAPLLPSTPKDLTVLIVTHGGSLKVVFSNLPQDRKDIVWEKQALTRAKELGFNAWNCSISEMTMVQAISGPSQSLSGWSGVIHRFAEVEHLLKDAGEPREGTGAVADISDTDAGQTGPVALVKAEAKRQECLADGEVLATN